MTDDEKKKRGRPRGTRSTPRDDMMASGSSRDDLIDMVVRALKAGADDTTCELVDTLEALARGTKYRQRYGSQPLTRTERMQQWRRERARENVYSQLRAKY
jgi:hypothetical protein